MGHLGLTTLQWAAENAHRANTDVERYNATGDARFLLDAICNAYGAELNYLDAGQTSNAAVWQRTREELRAVLVERHLR